MTDALTLLMIEDSERDAMLLSRELKRTWPALVHERIEDAQALTRALEIREWDIVLCDKVLPRFSVDEALKLIARAAPDLPLIVVSGQIGTEEAVELLMGGAADFVRKDDLARLPPSIKRAMSMAKVREAEREAREKLESLNRILRMMTKANEVLVRANSERHLLDEINRIIVDDGGFLLSWAAFCDPDATPLTCEIVSQYGHAQKRIAEYMAHDALSRDDGKLLRRVLESGRPMVASDLPGDSEEGIVLPLRHRGEGFGVLVVIRGPDNVAADETLDHMIELANDVAYGVVALREAEARRRAEADLAKARSLSERFLEVTDTMIVALAADGTIKMINRAGAKILGWTPAELIGENWFDLVIPEKERDVLRALHRENIANGGSVYHDNPVITRDGRRRLIQWHNTVLDANADDIATLSSGDDVTERRELEINLRQSQKLDALGNLAGGIAHDINNMLLPIMTLTEMVQKGMDEGKRDYLRLEKVLDAARRARDLCSRILAFSHQVDAPPHREIVDAREMVHKTVELLRSTISKTITIVERLGEDVGKVEVDRDQIATVLMNLAVNAADAMEGTVGTLTIGLGREAITAETAARLADLPVGDYVVLTVADTGTGMDTGTAARAFDPFFTTKDVGRGTGLGLSMAHGIVANHGGAIEIESAPGAGTVLSVYLPARD